MSLAYVESLAPAGGQENRSVIVAGLAPLLGQYRNIHHMCWRSTRRYTTQASRAVVPCSQKNAWTACARSSEGHHSQSTAIAWRTSASHKPWQQRGHACEDCIHYLRRTTLTMETDDTKLALGRPVENPTPTQKEILATKASISSSSFSWRASMASAARTRLVTETAHQARRSLRTSREPRNPHEHTCTGSRLIQGACCARAR